MEDTKMLLQLIEKKDLSVKTAQELLASMFSGQMDPVVIASLLIALRAKGESENELLGFIQGMRSHMNVVTVPGNSIDTCGTGGDGKNTFNISTAVSLVVAGAGVSVAKHGNRSASSKCGSADVLEVLGVNIQLNSLQASRVLKKVGMVFLFAPLYHSAMKTVAPIRKTLGVKTIFNFLGPFSNPGKVTRQIIGVSDLKTAEKLSHVAAKLNYSHLLIVSSEDGMDEISLFGKTHAFEIKKSRIKKTIIDPKKLGFSKVSIEKIKGRTASENAEIIANILNGQKGAYRDIVVLNAAYALQVSGKIKKVQDGITVAEKSIDSGNAKKMLEDLIRETKQYE